MSIHDPLISWAFRGVHFQAPRIREAIVFVRPEVGERGGDAPVSPIAPDTRYEHPGVLSLHVTCAMRFL